MYKFVIDFGDHIVIQHLVVFHQDVNISFKISLEK